MEGGRRFPAEGRALRGRNPGRDVIRTGSAPFANYLDQLLVLDQHNLARPVVEFLVQILVAFRALSKAGIGTNYRPVLTRRRGGVALPRGVAHERCTDATAAGITSAGRIFVRSAYSSDDVPILSEEDDSILGPTSVGRWGYACTKAFDEFLARAYYQEKGLPVVILRFFNTVGPRQVGRYGMVMPMRNGPCC